MNHQQNENNKNIISNQNNYSHNNYDADELGNQINSLKALVQSTSLDLEKDFNELENKLSDPAFYEKSAADFASGLFNYPKSRLYFSVINQLQRRIK